MVAATYSSATHMFMTSVILAVIILAAIVGNVFVLLAILLERNLHNVTNYLIASLAVADLMVAALVMPLAAVKEVSVNWFLGAEACDAFLSFDVLCCTASILHLVSISLDRYWAVSRVDYSRNRTARRILIMIAASWGISAVISIAPLFGWRNQLGQVVDENVGAITWNNSDANLTDGHMTRPMMMVEDIDDCLISQDWGYTVFSTLGAFYIPLAFMIIIYARIYQLARARIRKKMFAKKAAAASMTSPDKCRLQTVAMNTPHKAGAGAHGVGTLATDGIKDDNDGLVDSQPQALMATTTTTTLTVLLQTPPDSPSSQQASNSNTPLSHADCSKSSLSAACLIQPTPNGTPIECVDSTCELTRLQPEISNLSTTKKHDVSLIKATEPSAREKLEKLRERKAARTLAIITGSFIGCWLPFFIVALVRPFCGEQCHFPELLVSIFTWLGYLSCLLNPIIYNVFNPDFRSASRKILFGKYRNRWRQ